MKPKTDYYISVHKLGRVSTLIAVGHYFDYFLRNVLIIPYDTLSGKSYPQASVW